MAGLAQRVFKVQKGEGTRVLHFTLLAALLQAGLALGTSASDALFLVKVGPDKLPFIYVALPVLMLGYTALHSYLLSRFDLGRVFLGTLVSLALGGIGFFALLKTNHPAAYYSLKLYVSVWYIGIYTLYWNFVDPFYDIQDAKRLFPLFSGGGSVGAMLGGGLVSVFTHHQPVERLFLIWAGLALLTAPLALLLWRARRPGGADEDRRFRQELQETADVVRHSHYVRLFFAVMFVSLALTALLEFQYSTIFAQGRKAEELAALLGILAAAVNAFNLLVNFFVFNRMVLALGVGNVALIGPLVYLASFLLLLLNPGFSSATIAFFAYQGILATIDWNNINFLFNAIPSQARKHVRNFVEGLCEPLATATAGSFLLLFGTRIGYQLLTRTRSKEEIALLSPEGISALGLTGAGLYVLLALLLRPSYRQAMTASLKQEWLDFARPAAAVLNALPQEERRDLKRRIEQAPPTVAADAARLLCISDPDRARAALQARREQCQPLDRLPLDLAWESLRDAEARDAGATTTALLEAIAHGSPDGRERALDALATRADSECVAPLLAASNRFSPHERRLAETVLAAIGPTCVPATVAALRNPLSPYRARSLAARALARLAFPQLEALSPDCIRTELRHAYNCLVRHDALERVAPLSGDGVAVLSRYYRDRQDAAVDFVLELLALGGRLPEFERLRASLRSPNRREQANAIETIEQGVERDVFKTLLPLLDGRAREEQVAFYRERIDPSPPAHDRIVADALESADPLERAAAAQAYADAGYEDVAERLRGLLRRSHCPLLRQTVLAALQLDHDRPDEGIAALATLTRAPLFRTLPLDELLPLARAASAPNANDDPAETLLVLPSGQTLGLETLFDPTARPAERADLPENSLRLPVTALHAAARLYPRIALGLLQEKARLRDAA